MVRTSKRNAWALALGLSAAALGLVGTSGPAAADAVADPAAAEKAKWAEHCGDVPFVVGYEKGMREVEFTGRPPMYFFTATW